MKTLIVAIMTIAVTTTAFFKADAQSATNLFANSNIKINITKFDVPEEPANYINTTYKNASTLSKASARALKDFSKSFNSPANTNWYDDGEGGFLAYFKVDETTTRVDYNKKGNWVYTVMMYTEKELPVNIGYDVKVVYPTQTINSVMEIHIANKMAYIIHTEDKKGYKTLRYTDEGGIEEIEDFQK